MNDQRAPRRWSCVLLLLLVYVTNIWGTQVSRAFRQGDEDGGGDGGSGGVALASLLPDQSIMWEPERGPDLSRTTDSVKLARRSANSSAWNGWESEKLSSLCAYEAEEGKRWEPP